MALDNYSALIRAIQDWSHRDDLGELMPDFIRLAEQEIDKGMQIRTNEKRATITPNTDDRFIPIPNDFLEMRSMRVKDGLKFYDMYYRTPEAMSIDDRKGRPFFFTINSKIEFDRIPDRAYEIEMTYYIGLSPLTETNQTNNVLTKYPSLYLHGALAALHDYARDEETAIYYMQKFQQELATANAQEKRGRYGTAPAPSFEGIIP